MNKLILIAFTLLTIFSSCRKEEVMPTHEITYEVEFLTPTIDKPKLVKDFSISIKYGSEVYWLDNSDTEVGNIWTYTYPLEKGLLVDIKAEGPYEKYVMSVYIDGELVSQKKVSTSEDYWDTTPIIISEDGKDENIRVGSVNGETTYFETDKDLPEISFIL